MTTATATEVALMEYLSSAYTPDMEFVDGQLVQRNVGTILPSFLQVLIAEYLRARCGRQALILSEARLFMSEGKYRIPDLMVIDGPLTPGKYVVDVPALTLEILSPDDTMAEVLAKCSDYARLGVHSIVLMDPQTRLTYLYHSTALTQVPSVRVAVGQIDFDLSAAMFAEELDRVAHPHQ